MKRNKKFSVKKQLTSSVWILLVFLQSKADYQLCQQCPSSAQKSGLSCWQPGQPEGGAEMLGPCRCSCKNEMQISHPKIIFYIPNIHPPVETSALLVDVWSVTAAGQNQHLLPIDSEADFDPFQALCAQSGRAQHEGSMLERGTEPTLEHWRVGSEVPSTQRICLQLALVNGVLPSIRNLDRVGLD